MEIDELLKIKALGNLLQYYHSDLTYILIFQRYKHERDAISKNEYLHKSPGSGSFQNFLNEFRIARNVKKEKVPELLDRTMEWVCTDQADGADDVDKFAGKLKETGLTDDKTLTSWASKVLFLNNPWVILPCDRLNRRALGVKANKYSDFSSEVKAAEKALPIDDYLEPVRDYLTLIEDEFKGKIDRIETIRRYRFLDKLLWVHGQEGRCVKSK